MGHFMKPAAPDAHIHLHIRSAYRQRGRAALMRKAALAALAQSSLTQPVELTIRLTDDAELHALNKQFRGQDKPTDVLSFGGEGFVDGSLLPSPPTSPPLRPRSRFSFRESDRGSRDSEDMPPLPMGEGSLQLGDIVISMERVAVQAKEFGHSADDELALMTVHGVLHLLGYDHMTAKRKKTMWQAQTQVFEALGLTNPLQTKRQAP
jgi:probable rRNA maturation factor